MLRPGSVAAVFLLAGLVTKALPQTTVENQFRIVQSDRDWVYGLTKGAKSQFSVGSATVQIEAIRSVSPETQMYSSGGELQNYLNVGRFTLGNRTFDIAAPFGATAVVPFANGRAEVYGGAFGVFVPYATPYSRPNSWLTQASMGVRVRLDPGNHLWLGTTAYYLTDFADKKRQWAYGTADLTFRFGR